MEYRSQTNGLLTFMEYWGFVGTALIIFALTEVFTFFNNLSGMPWIYIFVSSNVLLVAGASLILYAKIPIYRTGRFFTFGVKSVPKRLAGFYRWGWRVFLFGVVLSLCLTLSRQ
jgi:hypothetical protein